MLEKCSNHRRIYKDDFVFSYYRHVRKTDRNDELILNPRTCNRRNHPFALPYNLLLRMDRSIFQRVQSSVCLSIAVGCQRRETRMQSAVIRKSV